MSVYICTLCYFLILAELFDFLQFFSGNGQHLNYPSQTSDLTKLVFGEQITTLILSSQIADQNSYLLLRLEWYDSDIKDSKPDGVFHDMTSFWYWFDMNAPRTSLDKKGGLFFYQSIVLHLFSFGQSLIHWHFDDSKFGILPSLKLVFVCSPH